jgi:ABC-type transport system substrate-binding protein
MFTRVASLRLLMGVAAIAALGLTAACGTTEVVKEIEVPGEAVIVTETVTEIVEVPGATITVTEIVEVPGETVIVTETVTEIVEVPGETVVVTEIVEVPGETVVVTEIVEVPGETVFVEVERPTVRPVPGAVLTVVSKDVGPPGWHTPTTPAPYNSFDVMLGVQENLLDVAPNGTYLPMIAREWVIDEAGITWSITPGVPWHDSDYGTVDAEDVFWSFENGSREGTVAHFTGWYAEDFQNPQIIDNTTVKWDWGEGGPTMRYGLTVRNFTSGTTIENKDYFDDVGEDEASRMPMGTGPFRLISHVGDDIITLEAVRNHWRNTSDWETVRVIEVPEQSTRIALMRTGQGDITDVGIPMLDQIVDEPGIRLVYGAIVTKRGTNFLMGGNWQIRTWEDGTPGPPLALENPWVGDPDVPGDLERAKNIRLALSYAIDREALNEFVLGGAGCTQYVYTIDTCSPYWQEKWAHPYDMEKAKEFLALGGFPDGFDMPLWIPTGLSDTSNEIAEAVVPMWEELGINISMDRSVYSSRRAELFRDEPRLTDVMAAFFGGNLGDAETFTDYLGDLIEGVTLWNSGYDYPEGYEIWDAFAVHYSDTAAAWKTLEVYWDLHSHLGEIPVVSSVDFVTPWVVGGRIGDINMIEHGYQSMPEIESLHFATE